MYARLWLRSSRDWCGHDFSATVPNASGVFRITQPKIAPAGHKEYRQPTLNQQFDQERSPPLQ